MMHPPIIRLGPPPNPKSNDKIVALISSVGWVMLRWSPAWYSWVTMETEAKVHFTEINCWLPQDGT